MLYGERGLHAFQVTRSARVRGGDLKGLEAFREDYPMARCHLVHGGTRASREGATVVLPLETCLRELPEILGA